MEVKKIETDTKITTILKKGDYEVRILEGELYKDNPTIELVKWFDINGDKACYVILTFIKTSEGYDIKTVGSRMFDEDNNTELICKMAELSLNILNARRELERFEC